MRGVAVSTRVKGVSISAYLALTVVYWSLPAVAQQCQQFGGICPQSPRHDPQRTCSVCDKDECCKRHCRDVMVDKNMFAAVDLPLTCHAYERPRSMDDFSDPFSNGNLKDDVVASCCQQNCNLVVKDKGLICPQKKFLRTMHDWHNPHADLSSELPAQIISTCCETTCAYEMEGRSLSCPAGKTRRHGTDWHNPFEGGDDDTSVKDECCRESCFAQMQMRNFQCDAGKDIRPRELS